MIVENDIKKKKDRDIVIPFCIEKQAARQGKKKKDDE